VQASIIAAGLLTGLVIGVVLHRAMPAKAPAPTTTDLSARAKSSESAKLPRHVERRPATFQPARAQRLSSESIESAPATEIPLTLSPLPSVAPPAATGEATFATGSSNADTPPVTRIPDVGTTGVVPLTYQKGLAAPGSITAPPAGTTAPALTTPAPSAAAPSTASPLTQPGAFPSEASSYPTEPLPGPARGLRLPAELPGAGAPPIQLPPYDADRPQQRISAIDQLFPNLPVLPPEIMAQAGPGGRPMRLNEFENLALANNPLMQQAIAQITAARGNAIQVGTHPNPLVGYEADTVGSQHTQNYQGGYFSQLFKTAGKLQLQQAAATMDIRNAELAVRRQRIGLITTVQARYYAVLVAEEGVRAMQALALFTDEAYRVQKEQLRGGEAAVYEPMQLRVLAIQARGALVQARNRYYSAWKQLAAVISMPDMPPTQLAGRLDVEVPAIRFDIALARALQTHTDILTARNSEMQARINLRFEEITPIPDFQLYTAVQRDYTGPPFGTTFNIQAGLPMPFYDRNVGGIMQARGLLVRAGQEATRVRNDLTNTAADAFERYENNRNLLEFYRQQMLPDQARVYRGVWERHQQEPTRVSFGDIIVAQQNLASTVTNYVAVLSNQWQAVADLLNVLQVEDLPELAQIGSPLNLQPPAEPSPPAEEPTSEPPAPRELGPELR
jgi:cobalt-zinc-cadmium efflux system outer membrane protein